MRKQKNLAELVYLGHTGSDKNLALNEAFGRMIADNEPGYESLVMPTLNVESVMYQNY